MEGSSSPIHRLDLEQGKQQENYTMFDRFQSEPITLPRGIDQGCPLSGVIFQVPMLTWWMCMTLRGGEDVVAFVDDTLMLVRGKTMEEASDKIKGMMERPIRGLE